MTAGPRPRVGLAARGRTASARADAAPLGATLRLVRPITGWLLGATLLGAATVAAGIGLLATSAWLISRASQQPSMSALGIAIVLVQFFGLWRGLARYGERVVGHDAAFRLLTELRVRVYERLADLAPSGLPVFRRGDLLARLVGDVDTLQDLPLRVIPPFVIAGLVGSLTVAFVWWLLPAAGVVLLVALALASTVVPWLSRRLARRSETGLARARGELAGSVGDLLDGLPDLVAYGAAEAQLARCAQADAQVTRVVTAGAFTAGFGSGATVLLTGLAMWGALVAGIPALRSGRLAGTDLAVIVLVPLAAFEIVVGLPIAMQLLERVRGAAARVFGVLDAEPPVTDPAMPAALPDPPGGLRARDLDARYHDGPSVLDGVDVDLGGVRRVAIVGPSGAGKSTLAAVLLRFLPYAGGSVTLGGVELDALRADDVRQVVGLAAQDAHVFDATLEENLRIARPSATVDELREALDQVRLMPWVDALPLGLSTPAGELGRRLSGGQRQRLVVARALLADFPVLVLDEPAEHLDTAAADALTADLLDVTSNRATLLITHRLAGLDAVDEVLVLEAGQVVERGTHDELVAAGGHYAWLWERELAADAVDGQRGAPAATGRC